MRKTIKVKHHFSSRVKKKTQAKKLSKYFLLTVLTLTSRINTQFLILFYYYLYHSTLTLCRAGNEYTRETAVMHCFQHGKLELVLLLLDAGATLDNRSFNIMLDRALQSSDDELLHLVIVAAACAMRCVSSLYCLILLSSLFLFLILLTAVDSGIHDCTTKQSENFHFRYIHCKFASLWHVFPPHRLFSWQQKYCNLFATTKCM